jgi:RNA polymerase sigma-70 factor (ECF subfamily)
MNEKMAFDSFEEMYSHLKGIVERYAFYLTSSRQNVEDTAQDIFIKVWLNWPKLSGLPLNELEDFVYIMTRNYVFNVSRRKRVERKRIRYYIENISDVYFHDDVLLAEGFNIYRQAIEQLSTKEKQLYLYFEKDYRRCQIAATVGRPKNTVNNQLSSAFKKVRRYLNKNFDLNINEDARCKIYSFASLN